MKNVLVLCTGNSCRSQLAEGYLRFYATESQIYSAGIETHGVNPNAIATMKADGIDISSHTSNNVNEYLDVQFDLIFTVCDHASENCPYIPGDAKRVHHNFPDPAKFVGTDEERTVEFARVRDLIKSFCKELAENENL